MAWNKLASDFMFDTSSSMRVLYMPPVVMQMAKYFAEMAEDGPETAIVAPVELPTRLDGLDGVMPELGKTGWVAGDVTLLGLMLFPAGCGDCDVRGLASECAIASTAIESVLSKSA